MRLSVDIVEMIYLRLRMKQDRERKQQHSTRMDTNGRNVLQSLIM